MSFTIPSEVFDLYKEICDELINNDNIGKSCTLFYQPNKTECPNCIFDSFTGKSTGVYKSGGPVQFNGLCPWCNGEGFKETDVSESIRLRLYWTRKEWLKVGIPMNINDADLMTIGFLTDMPKCQQAAFIRINTSQSLYGYWDFILSSEPYPHGFGKNKYFIGFWTRK